MLTGKISPRQIAWFSLILFIQIIIGLSLLSNYTSSIGFLLFIAAFTLFLINPYWVYYAIIWSVICERIFFQTVIGKIFLFEIITVLAIIAWIFDTIIHHRTIYFRKSPIDIPLIILILWITLSFTWTSHADYGVRNYIRILPGFIIFFYLVNTITNAKFANQVLWSWIIGGTALGLIQLITAILGIGLEHSDISQLLAHSNSAAPYLNFSLCLTVAKYVDLREDPKRRWLIIAAILILTGFFLSASRGAYVGLLAGILYLFWRFQLLRTFSLKYIITFGGVLIIISVFSILPFILNFSKVSTLGSVVLKPLNLISIVAERKIDDATKARFIMWGFCFDNLSRVGYIKGMGIGGVYHTLISKVGGAGAMRVAHSIYLSVLFDYGLIGMFMLFWIIFCLIKYQHFTFKNCKVPGSRIMLTGITVGLITLGVHGLADHSLYDMLVYAILGSAVALSMVIQEGQDIKIS